MCDEAPRKQVQVIRDLLGNVEAEYNGRALDTLLYTASETGMLDYSVSVEDAVFIAELVLVSRDISDEDLKKVRM